jgi:transposase
MPRLLTTEQRWAIITFHERHLNYRDIAEQVGCSRGAIKAIVDIHAATGGVNDARHPRAAKKLGGAAATLLLDTMVGKVNTSLRKVKKKLRGDLGVNVSIEGIRKHLHSIGLAPRHRPVTTAITRLQTGKRLAWCHRFRGKPKSWWEKVVFVDEKNFGAAWPGNRHNDTVWGFVDTVIPERHVSRYQASIKVGGVLSYKGRTAAPYEIPPPWNGPAYGRMLKEHVFPYIRRNFTAEAVVFFQDNDPSHLTGPNKKLLRESKLLFEGDYIFPSNSGDLNPVENLWSIVLEGMEGGEALHDSASILASVQVSWRKVKQDSIKKMVHSMPARIEACIAAEGRRTKW